MSLWARDQMEIIDHDTVTVSGLQRYLESYQALGVFHYAALEEKLEGEPLAMIQDVTMLCTALNFSISHMIPFVAVSVNALFSFRHSSRVGHGSQRCTPRRSCPNSQVPGTW